MSEGSAITPGSPGTGSSVNRCREVIVYTPQSHAANSVDSVRRRTLESQYLRTYQALHFGGKETLESKLIRSSTPNFRTHSDSEMAERCSNYSKISSYLNNLSDEQLAALLANATPLGSGVGTVWSANVNGVAVFIKKIPLTAIEQQNPGSTRNLFGLPACFQYNIGSMGFGARRELACHEITTQWVLHGECQNFPLMYASREMARSTQPLSPTAKEMQKIEEHVDYWNRSDAVGRRELAAHNARADIVLFMEQMPRPLFKKLNEMKENDVSERVYAKIEFELMLVASFMKSHGFLHFDGHFANILANEIHIYFADFGLAISREFDLSPEEREFYEQHVNFDFYQIATELAMHTSEATPSDPNRAKAVKALSDRYMPIAKIFIEFLTSQIKDHSKSTRFPEPELSRKWAEIHHLKVLKS